MEARSSSQSLEMKPVLCSICYEHIIGEALKEMIQCQFCSRAFHFECIEEQLVCDTCDERVLWPKTGTEEYLDLLECVAPTFPTGNDLFIDLDGESLTIDYMDENGFDTPIKVRNKEGLDLKVPHSEFSVDDVIRHCGPDLKVDVINVKEQADQQMTLFEFGEYFKHKNSVEEVFNLISLEFSDTQLIHLVKPPKIVRELSWVSTTTHDELKEQLLDNIDLSNTEFYPFGQPQVLRYCLISAQNSFTDFHIDFGGTSVWYHLLWGRKVFYMIEPTDKHLQAFEDWMNLDSRDRTHSCFVEKVDRCYRCEFSPGETIFIPAGWIHGVYTPEDSLVFGGNFLQYYGVPVSLKIYEMEERLELADKFTFPDYELVNFIAAKNLCDLLISWKSVHKKPTIFQIKAIEQMLPRLKDWYDSNARLRQDLRVAEEPIKVKKLFKTLERLIKREGNSSSRGAGGRGRDLKVKISLKDEYSDDDDSFYCPNRSSYPSNRTDSKSGAHKVPPINLPVIKNEIIGVQEEVPSIDECSSPLSPETLEEDSEMDNISLKVNAKLIHTLPVQKTKDSSHSEQPVKRKRGKKSEGATTVDKKAKSKAAKKPQTTNHDGPNLNFSKLPSYDSSCAVVVSETSENLSTSDSSAKSCSTTASSKVLQSNAASSPKKPRKGCATPKQRLVKMDKSEPSFLTSPCHLSGFICDKWAIASWDELKFIHEMIFPVTVRKGKTCGNVSSKELGDLRYESVTQTELISFIKGSGKEENRRWLYLDYKYVCDLFSEQVMKMFDWGQLGLPASANYVCSFKSMQ